MNKQLLKALISDPLSAPTRTKRQALLGVGAASIVIVKAGLIPKQFQTFGLTFSPSHQRTLILALFAVTLYYLTAFVVYALRDILALRMEFLTSVDDELVKGGTQANEIQQRVIASSLRFWEQKRWFRRMSWYVGIVRWVLDFVMPIAIAVFGAVLLWSAS